MYNPDLIRGAAQPARRRAILHDLHPGADDFRAAVIAGLSQPDRALPCRFLYDETGSALFDAICELPEYYPTRTEARIVARHGADIACALGAGTTLIDLGD